MRNLRNLMFTAAMLAGTLGVGAASAQAAEVRVYAHGPVVYEHARPIVRRGWVAGPAYGYSASGPHYGVRERGYARFDGRRRNFDRRDRFHR